MDSTVVVRPATNAFYIFRSRTVIMDGLPSLQAREIALTALFAATVCVSTLAFTIGITATQGYFNVGEIMVYTSALVLGPFLGAIAGGVGSAVSDLIAGPIFAPGTLFIKGIEAFLVGYIAQKKPARLTIVQWRYISGLLAILVSTAVFLIGATIYSGAGDLTLGVPPYSIDIPLSVPLYFWLALSVLLAVTLVLLSVRVDPSTGWLALAIVAGGTEMVAGYLVYEYFVTSGTGAFAEIPFNIGQMLIGLTVGLPLAKTLRAAFPWLSRYVQN